jgi:hypothetical protein
MLKLIKNSITLDDIGAYNNISTDSYIGNVIGFQFRNGTASSYFVSISGYRNPATSRVLFNMTDPVHSTFYNILRQQQHDSFGNIIGLDTQYLSYEQLIVSIAGNPGETLEIITLLDTSVLKDGKETKKMLHSIRKTITTAADGSYTETFGQSMTGKFIGFENQVGTMTNCTFTVKAISSGTIATSRTLYTKAALGTTSFLSVKTENVDAAGAAIAGEYDHQYLVDEKPRIEIASGGNAKTLDVRLLFEVERTSLHT